MSLQFYIQSSREAVQIDDKPFASGGEGSLYNVQGPTRFYNYVAKIFHPHKRKDNQRAEKINYLINNRPQFEYNPEHQTIIWVEHAICDERGDFVGFIMPKATGEKLEVLCAPKMPKYLGLDWSRLESSHEDALKLRLKVCYNLAVAIHQIHATEHYVLVDLKPDNVLIHSNGLISIVDTDSIEVLENGETKFPATVVTPEYSPAEYYEGVQPNKVAVPKSWDYFSMAVIFYRMLFGIHPFAASSKAPYDHLVTLGDKIHHGLYVHSPSKQALFSIIPPPHQKFEELDEELRELFQRAFDQGHQNPDMRPTAEEWANAFLNSPHLIIDRPLPSRVVNLHSPMMSNWYEMAVQKAISELKLTEPQPSQLTPSLLSKKANISFWQSVLNQYKSWGRGSLSLAKFGAIVVAVIVGFIVAAQIFSSGFELDGAISILFRPFGMGFDLVSNIAFHRPWMFMFLLIPLMIAISKKGTGYLSQKLRDGMSLFSEKMAFTKEQRRRFLEDKQYQYFSKRVQLKQRAQEIQMELTILEQVKSKKEQEFQQSFGQQVHEINQEIQRELSNETEQIQKQDQKARSLMRAEALEIRTLRVAFMQKLKEEAPYNQLVGNNPEQKIAYLEQWKKSQDGDAASIEAAAKEIENSLVELRANLDAQILAIQKRYDQLHQELTENATEYKIKIDDLTKNAAEKIRLESKLDSNLLNKSYQKLLKTRNELLLESYNEDNKLDELNEEIRVIRDELTQLR